MSNTAKVHTNASKATFFSLCCCFIFLGCSCAIGHLTRQTRKIRITNVLSNQSDVLEVSFHYTLNFKQISQIYCCIIQVCCEESLADIRERYLKYNSNAKSYTWKSSGRVLNMEKTLEENGTDIL